MKTIKTLTVAGETYALGHTDDTKVGDGSWSAKKLIDTLCPGFAVTGKAVSCYPVEGYPLEVVSTIPPRQEGTPALDNPCPILGTDGLTLTHNGEEIAAPLGETIYGGTYNWQTGELTVAWKLLTCNGTEQWDYYRSYSKITSAYVLNLPDKVIGYGTSLCNLFHNIKSQKAWQADNMTTGTYSDHNTLPRAYFDWGEPIDNTDSAAVAAALATFKAWLKERYDAGTPVELCYKLATPITVQAEPQAVFAKAGENVFSAQGEVTVCGRWDLKKLLEGASL